MEEEQIIRFGTKNGGTVISTTIDKYSYLNCRRLPPYFDYKIRVTWKKNEFARNIDEIKHPTIKASLKFLNFKDGFEVYHLSDLPAGTGLGPSSSFEFTQHTSGEKLD